MSAADEPSRSGAPGAERWIAYLDWARSAVADGVLRLSPDEQRTSLLPSGWTPIELLSHVLHMERRWFLWGFLGDPVPDPWGDWTRPEPFLSDFSDALHPGARWHVPADVSAESLRSRLQEVGVRTAEILRAHPLDARGSTAGRFTRSDAPTLEWICFHVLSEYTRHAGHLDIAVELAGDAR